MSLVRCLRPFGSTDLLPARRSARPDSPCCLPLNLSSPLARVQARAKSSRCDAPRVIKSNVEMTPRPHLASASPVRQSRDTRLYQAGTGNQIAHPLFQRHVISWGQRARRFIGPFRVVTIVMRSLRGRRQFKGRINRHVPRPGTCSAPAIPAPLCARPDG